MQLGSAFRAAGPRPGGLRVRGRQARHRCARLCPNKRIPCKIPAWQCAAVAPTRIHNLGRLLAHIQIVPGVGRGVAAGTTRAARFAKFNLAATTSLNQRVCEKRSTRQSTGCSRERRRVAAS